MTGAPVHGTWADRFSPVVDAFAQNFVDHGEVGAGVHVIVDGTPVVDIWGGHVDADRTVEWAADTLVNVYSVGKAFAATLVLRLVDEGRIDLDAPVASYWPDFAQNGKGRATVRHLLCHRVGVPAIREQLTDDDLFDFETMVDAVARTEPWWTPGEGHAYHTNTYGHLTGGLLAAVTGERPGMLLRRHLAEPLGADVHVGVADADLDRCADVVWAGGIMRVDFDDIERLGPDQQLAALSYVNPPGYSSMGVVNSRAWRQTEVPSTNTHATARGVARVYGGIIDGNVLSDEVLAEAVRVQSAGWCPLLGQDVSFGLGFQPWTEARPLGRTPGSYGHFGSGGALGFADPTRRIAFGYVMNHVVPRWQSPRNRALVDAVYDCL
ncbi:serine hydrolase domain-containing protein [Actinospongicola halichondriae]|uniref:serine hydrolase domain-containing protein n=1 Tax=Actinospongicola halichondriae TaxID=3236844 RepID=UPI003D4A1A5C